uniref:YhfC family intramembrane metalloprotease n=1 Tax=Ignisphaera aggregans TaxID=334771 RepID=A0A7J2U191_9CREN
MFVWFYPLFPVVGGLLAMFFIYMLGFKRFYWREFFMGLAILFICIGIQVLSYVQQIPLLPIVFDVRQEAAAMNITDPATISKMVLDRIYSKGILFIVGISLWAGFMAGIIQETLKYLWIRKSSYIKALNIGLGFGFAEALAITLLTFPTQVNYLYTASANIFLASAFLSIYERFASALFHVGLALFMLDMVKRSIGLIGLGLAIAIHGAVDSLAMLYQYLGEIEFLAVSEVLLIVTALILTLKIYGKALAELISSPT